MTKTELIKKIMRECEADGEPVTEAEATEMAEMEMKANADRRYEKSDKERKPVKRERKIDTDKSALLKAIRAGVEDAKLSAPVIPTGYKDGAEFTFRYNGGEYTVKLIKHRPPKGEGV